jgi:hypothetical protein
MQVGPSITHSPEEAVAVQLRALQANDDPWPNHGLQVCYNFGLDLGGLDNSYYFQNKWVGAPGSQLPA